MAFPRELATNTLPRGGLRAWLNQLLRAARSASRIEGGAGITVRYSEGRVTIAQKNAARSEEIDAVITAVQTTGAGPFYQAQNVTYSAVGRYRPDAVLESVSPKYGRPCIGEGAVEPAKVDDRCRIIRERQDDGTVVAELLVWSEKLAVSAECGK